MQPGLSRPDGPAATVALRRMRGLPRTLGVVALIVGALTTPAWLLLLAWLLRAGSRAI